MHRIAPKFTVKFLAIVLACVMSVVAFIHFLVTDQKLIERLFYVAEAPIAKIKAKCSGSAPSWMGDLVGFAIESMSSLGNQLAYIDPYGSLHHCESGWDGKYPWDESIGPVHRFRYASLTKLVTADAVMTLLERAGYGEATLLVDVLPEIKRVKDHRIGSITFGHLLRHQAGFDRLKTPDYLTVHKGKPWCPYEVEKLSYVELDYSPGERFSYSNLGYCLLGVAIERLSGQSYRDFIVSEYGLIEREIKFIDGPYLSDEVRYDFRNSVFYSEKYYRYFDFTALSSAAGLSGNAVAFAELVREIVSRPEGVLSAKIESDCFDQVYNRCFGYAVTSFRKRGRTLTLNIQDGNLFGVTSKVVVDGRGGVLVWLGNGMPDDPYKRSREFESHLYDFLDRYYARVNRQKSPAN